MGTMAVIAMGLFMARPQQIAVARTTPAMNEAINNRISGPISVVESPR